MDQCVACGRPASISVTYIDALTDSALERAYCYDHAMMMGLVSKDAVESFLSSHCPEENVERLLRDPPYP
jgi:hypothetical protein